MIPTARGIQCALQYNQSGLECYNIINVKAPAPATSANLLTVAGIIENWERNVAKNQRSISVQAVRCTLTALDGPGAPFLQQTYALPLINGAINAAAYPPNVSLAVALRSGLSGRSFRGRVYHIGLAQTTNLSAGLVSAAVAAAIAAIYDTLRSSLATAGFPLQVLSLYSGVDGAGHKIPRDAGLLTPVTQIACGLRLDSMRKRLPVEARV
jgi:hypothetical protein